MAPKFKNGLYEPDHDDFWLTYHARTAT